MGSTKFLYYLMSEKTLDKGRNTKKIIFYTLNLDLLAKLRNIF